MRTARAAFEEWAQATPAERARVLLRLADLVEDDADELTRLEVEETGKPAAGVPRRRAAVRGRQPALLRRAPPARSTAPARGVQLAATPRCCCAGRSASSAHRAVELPVRHGRLEARARRSPRATRWSSSRAPQTPALTLRLAALFARGGRARRAASAWSPAAPRWARPWSPTRVWTWSASRARPATGRRGHGGRRRALKRVHLELGGKAPALVFEDADLEAMARGGGAGRHVQHGPGLHRRHPRLRRTRRLRRGGRCVAGDAWPASRSATPGTPATDIGPLISADAPRPRSTASSAAPRPGARGARRRRAARRASAAYYPPTLVADAAQDSEIVQGEVFGPVLVVVPFDGEDEAVRLANDTPLRPGVLGLDRGRRPGAAGLATRSTWA